MTRFASVIAATVLLACSKPAPTSEPVPPATASASAVASAPAAPVVSASAEPAPADAHDSEREKRVLAILSGDIGKPALPVRAGVEREDTWVTQAPRRAPTVRIGSFNVGPGLPKEVVQRVVRQQFGRFRMCYERGLQYDPTQEGSVTVQIVIGADGTVTNSTAAGTLSNPSVASCMAAGVRALSFPTPEKAPVLASFKLILSTPE